MEFPIDLSFSNHNRQYVKSEELFPGIARGLDSGGGASEIEIPGLGGGLTGAGSDKQRPAVCSSL